MRYRLVLAALLSAAALVASAELYRVTVTRIDQDLYKDVNSKTLIETKYCYEYATRDDAVLRWEGKYGNNKLTFSSGTSCDVKALR